MMVIKLKVSSWWTVRLKYEAVYGTFTSITHNHRRSQDGRERKDALAER